MSLKEAIQAKIQKQGAIPFAEYMQMALYSPNQGYYCSDLRKFGPEGDFITAPELGPLFAYSLAAAIAPILRPLEQPCIFEFGAGSGQLAIDCLQRLEQLNALPKRYYILELSAELQARQQENIKKAIPHLADRLQWLQRIPDQAIVGVIIANEVLDAMPVRRFLQTAAGRFESYIDLNAELALEERYLPVQDPELREYLDCYLDKDYLPYQSEANLFIPGWIKVCADLLQQGAVYLFDYGFPAKEYYHADRNQGTLACHYQHQVHFDPLAHPGEEDITAHVNFSYLAEMADAAGFEIQGYCNQASFLLSTGILAHLEEIKDEKAKFRAQQQLKQLVFESEMGELIKVLALSKDLELELAGFELQNRLASL